MHRATQIPLVPPDMTRTHAHHHTKIHPLPIRRVQHCPTHFPFASDSTHKKALSASQPLCLKRSLRTPLMEYEKPPFQVTTSCGGEESGRYLVPMIRRTCTGSGSPSWVPSEEPSESSPVHHNAVQLRREDSPVPTNQQCSSSPEDKTETGPVSVDASGEDLSFNSEEKPVKDKPVKDPERVDAPGEVCGREKLKRHRVDVAGQVWIPDIWGQEGFLKDWIDCSAFDRSLFPSGISSARKALMEEGRRANARRLLQIEKGC